MMYIGGLGKARYRREGPACRFNEFACIKELRIDGRKGEALLSGSPFQDLGLPDILRFRESAAVRQNPRAAAFCRH